MPEVDLVFRFEDRAVAGLVLDAVQDAFPWYQGRLIEGPALARVRTFMDRFQAAELEFDFAPYHPDEQPYAQTELCTYVRALTRYRQHRTIPTEDRTEQAWRLPWREAPDAELDRYLEFLDWRRWLVAYRAGRIERGIGLPPRIDLATGRDAYRIG